jgi:hypothetical protein
MCFESWCGVDRTRSGWRLVRVWLMGGREFQGLGLDGLVRAPGMNGAVGDG